MSSTWTDVAIRDLGHVVTGATPKSTNDNRFNGSLPFITPTDLDIDRRTPLITRFVSDSAAAQVSKRILPPRSICFTCIGATIGKMCLTEVLALTNQQINSVVVDPRRHDSSFVYYRLLADRDRIKARAGGAATPIISKSAFEEISVNIPELSVQQKIAAVLSAYDDLIENNYRRVDILEEMAQRIYREWFVDLRYPGHEVVSLVDSELGPIPEHWNVCALSDLVTTQYGYTESATTDPIGPRFLRGMDINKTSYIDWSTVPFCPIGEQEHAKYRLSVGDIVVIRMADPGKVGIVESNVDAVFASYLIRVRPENDQLLPHFLFYFMSSTRYQSFVTGASTGTTRKSLSAPGITSIRLAVPPAHLQRAFADNIGPMRDLLNQLVRANDALRSTRDLLVPRLMSGEVDVSDLDIAIP